MKERTGYVYELRCKINDKGYVGQTIRTPKQRWRDHVYVALSGRSKLPLHRAIRKYGIENFTVRVIWTGSESKLNAAERRLIRRMSTMSPFGYNLTYGGEGLRATPALRRKLSRIRKRYFKEHPEARQIIRIQMKKLHKDFPELCAKFVHAQLNRQWSDKDRKAQSKRLSKGHPCPEHVKQAISDANTGKVRPTEQRVAQSEVMKAWWKVPKNRKRMKLVMQERDQRPGYRESITAAMHEFYKNPANRAAAAAKQTGKKDSPETIERKRQAHLRYRDTPGAAGQYSEASKKAWITRRLNTAAKSA